MSLRKALSSLPDDRATRSAVHDVVLYLDSHRDQPFDLVGVARGTGLDRTRIVPVLDALRAAFVIDCDGDPRSTECTYDPDSILSLEVRRFLRSTVTGDARLQRGVDRFRGRNSPGI